ncbi:MAG TPA: F0F1 ATP synthase subunit alpha [Ruminococcaceae bacterium]|jgi:F-type H+-transporting ATPase subunit alpha|nr:MAG: F0F1 ATP synthase subunit alpha [Clostridiales bacterium 41_21_two_genomes]HCK44172.1 F0F1 ATP synthase subunit alpha [Oscillospiraceae bacterium]
MLQKIDEYVTALLKANVSADDIDKTDSVIKAAPEVSEILDNPAVSHDEKAAAVNELFPASVREFLLSVAENQEIASFAEIAKAYHEALDKKNNIATATVTCVTEPSDEQLDGLKAFVCKETGAADAKIELVKDPSIIGGFIIQVGNKQYDRSLKSKLSSIKEEVTKQARKSNDVNAEDVIAVLKKDIKDYKFATEGEEIGSVITVGDGIATIHGLDHAMYGEIVVFECGVKGMIQDIKKNSVGCILFGSDSEIYEGSKVKRTHKKAGVPVGDAFIGRIVNALGEPIDGKGDIPADDYRLVEQSAPSIVERKKVSQPLETGILAIDSMFPIGRGQRELIIGDRQTGKTSIALDTILNQKGKDCICIYNAIGQKASTVAKLVGDLEKHGAMDYTIVVCSTAADPASLQYISPYSATAIAEYFMYKGKDCLIVYDDLSKHAVAYRAISLLLERPPGREAYPGDVFYLHSRLLERSSRLSDELGGGSITALPIIETQAGDVSAYIPTNVISITDGQIYLESDLFFSGQRPAVNVGLSVSRVGGDAQTKAMKKAAGSLRVDLAQFREMEVFTQFSSDLDDETKANLAYGEGLMQLLKQPLGNPMSLSQQVVTLVAAIGKRFVGIATDDIKKYQGAMLDYFAENKSDIMSEIESLKVLDGSLREQILNAVDEFSASYNK